MKFEIGDRIRDPNQSVYDIVDSKNTSNHYNQCNQFKVNCIEGPNAGKTGRWVSVETLNSLEMEKICT